MQIRQWKPPGLCCWTLPGGLYSASIVAGIDKYCYAKRSSRIVVISQSILFQFLEEVLTYWEIGADWENTIICHSSGLVNTLVIKFFI